MENKHIKNRLYQVIAHRSPKHPVLLEEDKHPNAPTLKPKKLQDISTSIQGKPTPMYKQGRLVLNPLPSPQVTKKLPQEVEKDKLSKEGKSLLEEGKGRIRNNLRPHDIFHLYDNFPEMMEDFFYLNRLEHPYDYQIVTYAQRNQNEYMTISSQGVTLYHDKEAEFLSRHDWLQDEKRYYALQKIYFFKQYKLSKNFRIWKNKMRRHYMREMQGILSEHLFLTVKYPRNCLLQIKYHTNCLRDSLTFFPFDAMEKLTPTSFVQLLNQHREKTLLRSIRQITVTITQSLECAVAEEINKFKQENNIKIDGVNQKQTGNKEGFVYSQEAILKKQYKRVYKLIKLVDSMVQQAKIQMVTRCLAQIIDKIKELQYDDKEPWISCTASIAQNGLIQWEPTGQSLSALFLEAISQHLISLNQQNQKIVNNPLFSKYRLADSTELKPEEQNRNSFKHMVEESPDYFLLLHEIQSTLHLQFQSTSVQEEVLQKFIEIYVRHKELASMSSIFKDNNGVQLCNYVEQWKRDDKDMGALAQEKKGKLLLYNYGELRRNIVGAPKQTLTSFFALLPDETALRCRNLILQSRTLLESISVYPTQIVSFARFNRSVRQAAERLQDIRSSGSQICLLVEMLSKNKLGNIDLYNSKKIQVLNSITALKNKVQESEAKENQSLSKFKKDNEAETAKIKANVKDLASRFNGIEFNQVKATAREMKEILNKIREILPAISNLQTQSLKIIEIEIELNLPETDFTQVHELYSNVKLINDVWTCRDDWKNLLIGLYHKHYCDVDCSNLRSRWEEFYNQISHLSKALPENEILKNLGQELAEVEVLIDTIAALRSPNLEEKSWREISEYLAYELGIQNEADFPFVNTRLSSYTVKWLLEINIPVYKEKIEFIVRKSEKERELSTHLAEYKNYIATVMVFETIQKKNEFYIFAQNKDIQQQLHHNLAHLYAMLDNQYSPSIRNEAETLIRHYQYIEEIVRSVLEFGTLWNKYENFFDSSASSLKLLTKESKQFAGWETQWKKIIKNITDTPTFYRKVYDQTLGNTPSRATLKLIGKTNSAIEQVKKGLEDYLERKRLNFPRYYFLTDQQLLQMLASIDPKQPISAAFVPVIYKHIQKIVYKEDTKDTLLGIISKEGQEFKLKNVNFKLQSQMEDIFKLTEEQIKKRLNHLIKTVFVKYSDEEITRKELILQNNTQVALAVDSIAWVRLAEQTYLCAEPIGDLYDWIEIQQAQINQLKALVREQQIPQIHRKIIHVLCQSLYFLEKTQQLLKSNTSSTESYEWDRIPKLCMANNNSDVYLKHLNTKLAYCYQFLGPAPPAIIEPNTERTWLAIAQALAARDTLCLYATPNSRLETLRQLGYLIGQEVEQVNLGEKTNFKLAERYINGSLYVGLWMVFNAPNTDHMLSFLAAQLTHVRKTLLDNNSDKIKGSISCNTNVAFFLSLSSPREIHLQQLLTPFSFRSLTLVAPQWHKVCSIMAESKGYSGELATKVVNVCQVMKQCFENSYSLVFSFDFIERVLERVISQNSKYDWLRALKCKQSYEYITCDVLDHLLMPSLSKQDIKVFDTLKSSIIPDYEKLKSRHPSHIKNEILIAISKFLDEKHPYTRKNVEYTQTLQNLVRAAISPSLGIVVAGKALSGKTSLTTLAAQFITYHYLRKVKMERIYHNAYNKKDSLSLQKCSIQLNESGYHWIVLDGAINNEYRQLFSYSAEKYIVPHIGPLSAVPHFKIISETTDTSKLSPSIIGNHIIITLSHDLISPEHLVRKLLITLEHRGHLINLHSEAVDWLLTALSASLTKLQNKNSLKSKSVNFAYSPSNLEISFRACRLIEAIFSTNWESIRDKEKNTKKMIDRFVAWVLYWSLIGLVLVDDEPKLQKFILQIARSENSSEDLANSMIYPNCGLQIQVINGLRTQSSLGIPEKGIITNLLRSDLVTDSDPSKTNKFFEEIVISQAHLIRVNYNESNRFNYLAQLASQTNTPIMLLGQSNSGKKSIVELYAKNMRAKSQFYSIRYKNRQTLSSQIEKPFRKLNGLKGIVLKSMMAGKKMIISIQDVSLDSQNLQTCQLLRMVFSQKGYYNKQAQWLNLTDCSFSLIAHQIATTTDHLRLLPHLALFQTSTNSLQKLHSIYFPYLKNWSAFNGMSGDIERIFSSEAGDNILDAILSIYRLFQDLHQNNCEKDSLQSQLLKPRIGDIAKTLAYICRTPLANHYNMAYYYELWAHEVVRVFGDRLLSPRHKQLFYKQIKKQALLKFKQNFNLDQQTMFNFTSLSIENQNCYIRVEDPAYLHNYISNLLQTDQINLPLKYLFTELLEYLIRIYRILAIEGAHILLLCHNPKAAHYLIQLTCQVGQNDCFLLNQELITPEKHIEPTLYFKEQVCFTANIQNLTEEAVYQIACLLNNNVYDFAVKAQIKEKIKVNLNKKQKQKVETQKKQSKIFGKTKSQLSSKIQQKQQDIEVVMAEQFMAYSHFVMQSNPFSPELKQFLKKQNDIVGKMHFTWIDIPECSLSKVSKQILSFDEEINELAPETYSDDKLIQKVRKIYATLDVKEQYFNDFLAICELVKTQNVRLQNIYRSKEKDLKQSRENMQNVQKLIRVKQQSMKSIHEQLQETNNSIQLKSKELQEINNKISQWQINSNGQQFSNEDMIQVKMERDEKEIDLKILKQKKQKLQPEKKKILKNIKIANDYLQLFNNSFDLFDQTLNQTKSKSIVLQDKLIIIWSCISYLAKKPTTSWVTYANEWINIINSSIPKLQNNSSLLKMINQFPPHTFLRDDLFCPNMQLKIHSLIWLLYYYQQTINFGRIPRVYDPKGILPMFLEKLTGEQSKTYSLLKIYPSFIRENRIEIQTLLKTKNGVVLIQQETAIDELQTYLFDKKMVNYFNKIIVLSSAQNADICLDCDIDQVKLSIEDLTLKTINPGIHFERKQLYQDYAKEIAKKQEIQEGLFRACSNINIQTETYIEEVSKYKNLLNTSEQQAKNIKKQIQIKKQAEIPELALVPLISAALISVWSSPKAGLRSFNQIYQLALGIHYSSENQQLMPQQKEEILKKITQINLDDSQTFTLKQQIQYSKRWSNIPKLLLLKPNRKHLQQLQKSYKLINFMTSHISSHISQTSEISHPHKIYYNFIPQLHTTQVLQLIQKDKIQKDEYVSCPLIIMSDSQELKLAVKGKAKIIEITNLIQSPTEACFENLAQNDINTKGLNNIRYYFEKINSQSVIDQSTIEYLEKNYQLDQKEENFIKYFSQYTDTNSKELTKYLMQSDPQELICNLKMLKKSSKLVIDNNKQLITLNGQFSLKEQLPYSFNISQFLPSKDPLAGEIISQCINFNQKLKIIKEQLKQPIYNWQACQKRKLSFTLEEIMSLNNQYQALKVNLSKMHIIAPNSIPANNKTLSSKAVSSHSISNQILLYFPNRMITPRTLNLLKCKASKKIKTSFFNIGLTWKFFTGNFNFEENCTSSDLCLLATGKIEDDLQVLNAEIQRKQQEHNKFEVIICPYDTLHSNKLPNQPLFQIPIKSNNNEQIGSLEVNKTDVNVDSLIGIQHLKLELR